MSHPAFVQGTKVVGWRPEIPPELATLLREAAYWDKRLDQVRGRRQRRTCAHKKYRALLEAHHTYPAYFLPLRRQRRGTCQFVVFSSKIGYPGNARRLRTCMHVPLRAIDSSKEWRIQCKAVFDRPRPYQRIRPTEDARFWPEDRPEEVITSAPATPATARPHPALA
ncbi:MAG: hypothetical protein WD603_00470 [Patescibacteria group bacterium]